MSNYQHYSQQLQPYCNRKIQGFSVKRLNNLRNSLSLFTAKLHFICIQMISYLSNLRIFRKHCPGMNFNSKDTKLASINRSSVYLNLCVVWLKGNCFWDILLQFSSYQKFPLPCRKWWPSELKSSPHDCNKSSKGFFSLRYYALCLIRLPTVQ